MTGIRNPEEIMKRYPFELSGGQQQRIVLAIALACRPSLLIADEPTTALDVTVQRQILDRLKRIAEETHTSVLLVSHDLGVVAALAKRILVMKDGEIIETGTAEEIFHEAKEQYTRELVEAARKHGSRSQDKRRISETILFQAEHLSFQYTKFHFLKKNRRKQCRMFRFFAKRGILWAGRGERERKNNACKNDDRNYRTVGGTDFVSERAMEIFTKRQEQSAVSKNTDGFSELRASIGSEKNDRRSLIGTA